MPILDLPDYRDYGYVGDSVTESAKKQMMDQRAAPPEFLNDLVWFCPDLCTEDCVCVLTMSNHALWHVHAMLAFMYKNVAKSYSLY